MGRLTPGRCPGVTGRVLALGLLVLLACGTDPLSPARTWSFERDMDGWKAHALDVGGGRHDDDVVAPWSAMRTIEDASHGAWSLKVRIDNRTDAAKVWIERPVTVTPEREYDVELAFDFGTADAGDVNLWRIIAGTLPARPRTSEDLSPVFQDDTRSGATGSGRRWLAKSYRTTVTAGREGTLYLVVGIWATYEVARSYYLDNIGVTLQER